ncbi:Vegetative incompatibility protein HET-E-1 [Madurella mycetomatis]|uniref:Vegetative incompatibility protein HET-E-1 n=1 Tax=Madurella mycetomatis TaxID=100816 RepID=A0A175W3I0_9PEZI|nr:Vegetative incompatibility protein HET-E-1 [Madurella mycetomatis]
MRLINVKTSKLEEFLDYKTPLYAILSHTWGDDGEELTFRDVEEGKINKAGIGSVKFWGSCRQAEKDGLGYVWIDTCCIDKTNLVELSEAINSMFRWYHRASLCYAYLSDVPGDDDPRKPGSKFRTSRWFGRGWTLQELLAPKQLRFYNSEWGYLGNKGTMRNVIGKITGIPRQILLGITELQSASVAQRMSWAAGRETKRKEDLAYCLLGIFGVTMPMIYGEGGDQAFLRLQERIMKTTRDDSILAWGLSIKESPISDPDQVIAGRILATAPSDFSNSGHIICREYSSTSLNSFDISGGSLRLYLPLLTTSAGGIVGLLNCGPEYDPQQVVGIPLTQTTPGASDERIHIRNDSRRGRPVDASRRYWLYDEDAFAEVNLDLVDSRASNGLLHLQVALEPDRQQRLVTIKTEALSHPPDVTVDVTTELQKSDLILELVEIWEARGQNSVEIKELEQKVEDKRNRLEQVKRERKMIEDELRKLEERRKMLAEEESNGAEGMRLLSKRQTEVKEQQERASKRWSHARKRWDELCYIDYDENCYGLEEAADWTPLQWAAKNGYAEMVKLLLDKGAGVAVANKDQLIPLHSVLNIPLQEDAPVRPFYLSFRDFLVDKTKRTTNEFGIDEAKYHRILADKCIQLMRQHLKKDICGLQVPGKRRSEVDQRTIDAALPLEVQYACQYWVHHLKESKGSVRDGGPVHNLLKSHLLYWLETLGLLGRISESIGMVDDLLALDPGDATGVSTFLRDIRRVVVDSWSIIHIAPLQLIASGSDDITVKIWDAATGRCAQTLERHGADVRSVAFSPDSKLIALGSGDRTVKIWDAATGKCVHIFEWDSDDEWNSGDEWDSDDD